MSAAPFEITVSNEPRGTVLRVAGEVDLRSSPALREKLLELVEQKPARVVLDLAGVSYLDSSGVGTIVEFKRKLDRTRGSVILAALQPRVRSVLEITKLDRFFTIVQSLEEALRP